MPQLSEVGALARRGDPDRFLCALFAPPTAREALFALLAFDRELARARAVASQPTIALIRLQWWREAVEDAAGGGQAQRHEVAGPLHAAIAGGGLDARDLLALLDAREAEVEADRPGRGALEAILRGTGGGVAVAAGRLLGAPAALLPALQSVGAAHALAGLLGGPASAAGACPLPPEMLEAHGERAAARRWAEEALPALAAARADLRDLPRAAVAAALPSVLAGRDLRRLAAGRGPTAGPRGVGDRLAVVLAGLRGRV